MLCARALRAAHAEEAALADLDERRAFAADFDFGLRLRDALAFDAYAALFDETARFGHGGREAGLDQDPRELPDLRGYRLLFYLVGRLLVAEAPDELCFGLLGGLVRVEVGDDAPRERRLDVGRGGVPVR